jgi:hypothetical protein
MRALMVIVLLLAPVPAAAYDNPADVADNFQGFISRHPQIAADVLNGTAATSHRTIRHTQGCTSACTETEAQWAARHADAVAQFRRNHDFVSTHSSPPAVASSAKAGKRGASATRGRQ